MIGGDFRVTKGVKSPFFYTIKEFSKYFERIDILCRANKSDQPTKFEENVFFHPFKYNKFLFPFFVYFKGLILNHENHFDLIISHDYGLQLNGFGSFFLSVKCNISFISEIHHIDGHPRVASYREHISKFVLKFYLYLIRKKVNRIRVVNRSDSYEFMKSIVPESKLLVLYSMYIDFTVYRPILIEKKYDFVFCGRMEKNKGLFLILQILSILKKTNESVKFLLIGKGSLTDKILKKIVEKGLTNNVRMIEWVETSYDLARLYNESKIMICASSSEGGPRVIIEAMACAIPVISTPVGLIKELVDEGRSGFFFDWDPQEAAQKIEMLLDDKDLCTTIGMNGMSCVQKFEYHDMIQKYALGCITACKN